MSILKGASLTILLLTFATASFGLLAIFSQNTQLATQQLLFLLLGFLILFLIGAVDIRLFKSLHFLFWFTSLFLVFFATFFGPEIRGANRWIELGFFRLQPTELAKPVAIFTLAVILEKNPTSFAKNLVKSLAYISPFVILSFFQPDLGNAIIFVIIWLVALFISGYPTKILAGVIALILVSLPFLFFVLAPYQKERIETFLNPAGDPLGSGYTAIQSQIAVGAGRIFGQGITGGTQSELEFLPEASTDFIFAALAEQLGFSGSMIFIGLFLVLIYKIITAAKTSDRFSQILVLEIASLLFIQFFLNIGMSIGLLPVIGVTLPFISYGGSSLLANFILLGLVCSQIKFAPKLS